MPRCSVISVQTGACAHPGTVTTLYHAGISNLCSQLRPLSLTSLPHALPRPVPRRVPGCAVQVDTGGNLMDMAGHPLETNPQKSGGNVGGKVLGALASHRPVHCRSS